MSDEQPNTVFNKDYLFAFVVTADDIQKLERILIRKFGTIRYECECADSSQREFSTCESLLSYENSRASRILKLSIVANESWKNTATVRFSNKWYNSAIGIEIRGKENDVQSVRRELEEVVAGTKSWYSWISRADIITAGFICYFLAIISLLIAIALSPESAVSTTPKAETSPKQKSTEYLILYTIIAAYITVFYYLNSAKAYIFPKGYFRIGQEERRYETLNNIRWGVIVPTGLSLILTLLGLLWGLLF